MAHDNRGIGGGRRIARIGDRSFPSGSPAATGSATVLVNNRRVLRRGDIGTSGWMAEEGASRVLVGGRRVHRLADMHSQCCQSTASSDTLIGSTKERHGHDNRESCWIAFRIIDDTSCEPVEGVEVEIEHLPRKGTALLHGVSERDGWIRFWPAKHGAYRMRSSGDSIDGELISYVVNKVVARGAVRNQSPILPPLSVPNKLARLVDAKRHLLKRSGSASLSSLASAANMTVAQLAAFNWRSEALHYACDVERSKPAVYVPRPARKLLCGREHIVYVSGVPTDGVVHELAKSLSIRRRWAWAATTPPYYHLNAAKLRWHYDRIVIHHSAGTNDTPESVRSDHMSAGRAGMDHVDVGYHFLVDKSGTVYEARSLLLRGSHTYPNAGKIGICLLGHYGLDSVAADKAKKFEPDTLPDVQWKAVVALVDALRSVFPDSIVTGHREHQAKACPGHVVFKKIEDERKRSNSW